jgi:hypothetical protein
VDARAKASAHLLWWWWCESVSQPAKMVFPMLFLLWESLRVIKKYPHKKNTCENLATFNLQTCARLIYWLPAVPVAFFSATCMQMLTHDARKDLSPIVSDFDFALADFVSDFFCFFGRIWLVLAKSHYDC